MSLNLYRRHCEDCKAERAPDSRTGEFEERKKGWKRCDCSIFASGTLKGRFKRRSTGVATWEEAKAAIANWKNWDNELPAPAPPPTDEVRDVYKNITVEMLHDQCFAKAAEKAGLQLKGKVEEYDAARARR